MMSQKNKKQQERLEYKDSNLVLKRNDGIDFFAKGDDPEKWTLTMDFDKTFLLETQSGRKIITPPAMSEQFENPEFEKYSSKGANDNMEISIFKEGCDKRSNSYKTTVFSAGKLYTGCGSYLINNQLNNKWILYQIDNELLEDNEFSQGIPHISIDLIKKMMYGFDGCNSISSGISVYGDRIKFSDIISTFKACENIKYDKIKLNLLSNHLVEYRFRNNDLILYLIDDSRLIFKSAF